jgi:hypothetical protein
MDDYRAAPTRKIYTDLRLVNRGIHAMPLAVAVALETVPTIGIGGCRTWACAGGPYTEVNGAIAAYVAEITTCPSPLAFAVLIGVVAFKGLARPAVDAWYLSEYTNSPIGHDKRHKKRNCESCKLAAHKSSLADQRPLGKPEYHVRSLRNKVTLSRINRIKPASRSPSPARETAIPGVPIHVFNQPFASRPFLVSCLTKKRVHFDVMAVANCIRLRVSIAFSATLDFGK